MIDLPKDKLEATLVSMLGTAKSFELYPATHPSVQQPLSRSYGLVAEILRLSGAVTLGVVDEVLVFGGLPFYSNQVSIKELQFRLTARGINAVEIQDGLAREEYGAFIRLLTEDPAELAKAPAVSVALRSRGITHIVAKDSREVYTNAIQAVGDVLREARLGRIPRAAQAKSAVADLKRMVLHDPPAMIGLTLMKSYDNYLFNHSVNVSVLALALARGLAVPDDDLSEIGLAGLLHDIGKTLTPKTIILKPGRLTPEEWSVMRQHPVKSAEIVGQMDGVSELVTQMVMEHHVNYNLEGYPELDFGRRPHPYSRIITVADCYDAITTMRPYQKPFHPRDAMRIMEGLSGKVIDPRYFEEFVKVLGIFPIGTLVRLDTNEVAVVVETRADTPLLPRIRVIFDPESRPLPVPLELDLAQLEAAPGGQRVIVSTVDPLLYNVDPANYL